MEQIISQIAQKPKAVETAEPIKIPSLKELVESKGFPLAAGTAVAILFVFLGLLQILPGIWFQPDSYYSHGVVVPFLAGYIALTQWDKLKELKASPSWIPVLFLIPSLYITWIASRTNMALTLSVLLVATIGLSVWMLAGWKIAMKVAPAVLYLLFGLPVWQLLIDRFTQPLQSVSADVAFAMLRILGFNMYKQDSTTILLDNFVMNVGAPCSGLRLILSLVALVVFFILIARLKWSVNLTLLAFIVPFAIVINGLRIMLIGVVGNTYGSDAGHAFHDYSGYIALVVCFIVLRKIFQVLGWK